MMDYKHQKEVNPFFYNIDTWAMGFYHWSADPKIPELGKTTDAFSLPSLHGTFQQYEQQPAEWKLPDKCNPHASSIFFLLARDRDYCRRQQAVELQSCGTQSRWTHLQNSCI
ncbi:uncharacterized protein LOC143435602 isoform X1 [Arvicanthis niloticus]|uniref:uncharacterized protein LOC143309913 isoform X1 n=1 Tax=Arvicanthis niloticus TaxID=61156 RepID=UPI00402B6F43